MKKQLLLEKISKDEMIQHIKDYYKFAKNHLNISKTPKVVFESDQNNADDFLGKTAYYDPKTMTIHLFVIDRHPKDIVRSFAHELIHHFQNLNEKLPDEILSKTHEIDYASKNKDLRDMEREAYEKGNMMFRDWTDSVKSKRKNLKEKIVDKRKNLKEKIVDKRKNLKEKIVDKRKQLKESAADDLHNKIAGSDSYSKPVHDAKKFRSESGIEKGHIENMFSFFLKPKHYGGSFNTSSGAEVFYKKGQGDDIIFAYDNGRKKFTIDKLSLIDLFGLQPEYKKYAQEHYKEKERRKQSGEEEPDGMYIKELKRKNTTITKIRKMEEVQGLEKADPRLKEVLTHQERALNDIKTNREQIVYNELMRRITNQGK